MELNKFILVPKFWYSYIVFFVDAFLETFWGSFIYSKLAYEHVNYENNGATTITWQKHIQP